MINSAMPKCFLRFLLWFFGPGRGQFGRPVTELSIALLR